MLTVDVACAEASTVILEAAQALGSVMSVCHAAGVLRDGVILRQKNLDALRTIAAPKLPFLENSSGLLGLVPQQTTCLFSSIAAFLGTPGQAIYAGVNSVLDRHALLARQQGLPGGTVHCCTI